MKDYSCPACGAVIRFQSSVTVSTVCPYCRSLIVRRDNNVDAIGKSAVLPDDISPFQIGTTGRDGTIPFTLIGRAKIGWEDGCWNEWVMFRDDGERAWLAEAQGFLAVSREIPIPPTLSFDAVNALELNQTVIIERREYAVTDIKQAFMIACEGEFFTPMPVAGAKFSVIDCLDRRGGFASISCSGKDDIACFIGSYVEFSAMNFGNLRELPGWTMPRATRPG